MKPLVKFIKLNNLQYNANRDPQVYRRVVNEPFRIQASLEGTGVARCSLVDAQGKVLASAEVKTPGMYTHEIAFPSHGIRVVTLVIERGAERFTQNLRLDVLDHAWIG